MISVVFRKNRDGDLTGFRVSGHAGYARAGEDIVCAAFSMLVINTINSLEALTDTVVECESDDKKGLIDCSFPGGLDEGGRVLMSALILGVDSIRKEYSEKYVRTEVETV